MNFRRRSVRDVTAPAEGVRVPHCPSTEVETEASTPYASHFEHLADELRWLDRLVHAAILRRRMRHPENPLEALKGLVLSDEEIDTLLAPDGDAAPEPVTGRRTREEAAALREHIDTRLRLTVGTSVRLPLNELARIFRLSVPEAHCLLVCLAPELDRKYGKLFAYLQDDVTRKRPSADLVATVLFGGAQMQVQARELFSAQAPLARHRLVTAVPDPQELTEPLLLRALRIDERLVDYCLGAEVSDRRLMSFCRPANGEAALDALVDAALGRQLREYLRAKTTPAVVLLWGAEGTGRRALADLAVRTLDRWPVWVDAARLLAVADSADCAFLAVREALLRGATPCICRADALFGSAERAQVTWAAFADALRLYGLDAVLISEKPLRPGQEIGNAPLLTVAVPRPSASARLDLWRRWAALGGIDPRVDLVQLASAFRFTQGQIAEVIANAGQSARWRNSTASELTQADLLAACRALSAPDLLRLAHRIEPRHRWEDIVLPTTVVEQLQEVCAQARHRSIVMGDWGFDAKLSHGKGIAALFSGPPGTGKTMAAEVIAGELGVDLYKIDLSQVISKYIGETEKNLNHVFTAAEHSNALLFFDEADALFGKRSEVRDSHDRYANVEISYLLQKMEEYDGLAILATNMRQHMDEAFVRRLRSIVEFPFPDANLRREIWRATFPAATPLAADVDFARLARDIRLAGGGIMNVALNAASLAAADGQVVAMRHLVKAAQREHDKVGRRWRAGEGVGEIAS